MNEKRKVRIDRLVKFVLCLLFVIIGIFLISNPFAPKEEVTVKSGKGYIASAVTNIPLYNLDFTEAGTIIRGTEVKLNSKEVVNEIDSKHYNKITYDKKEYLINLDSVVKEKKDSVKEKEIYVRTPSTVYEDGTTSKILGFAKKGNKLEVLGYDEINENGIVNKYKIKYNDKEGYIYGKYMEFTEELALQNYDEDGAYQTHKKRTNTLGGGSASNLDYFPVDKPHFSNNVMPENAKTLYLNSGVLGNVDAYIALAKQSNINAFVVDIKDNTSPGYKSKIMQELSPTNYEKAHNSFENYKTAIKKLKDAGFYVIGRITTFKDNYYVKDNPEDAILNTATNGAYLHDGANWPSAFKRDVWYFTIELAKEAVTEMGFNEIQFDYVRFPDRTGPDERTGIINFQNDYDEEKAEAIQNFLRYACDEIHAVGAYVSADVFGESAHNYVTGYGQYWSAISNVVDVISGMPYPELFNKYEYGLTEPVWTIPYQLISIWAKSFVVKQQALIPTPALVRTWIQAYDATWRKPATSYDSYMVSEEIRALYDGGLNGGFITWNSGSNLSKYEALSPAFKKEY